MKISMGLAQLALRLALSAGFILPVLDRLGVLGPYGSADVAWGDWQHFSAYTASLMPFAGNSFVNLAAVLATVTEIILAMGLLLGYRTRYAALGTALLTLVFALFMIFSSGIMAPFKYPVFVFSTAALLLSRSVDYPWSLARFLDGKIRRKPAGDQ